MPPSILSIQVFSALKSWIQHPCSIPGSFGLILDFTVHHATAVNTGVWTENNPSNVRRAGDEIVYTIVTTNSGTVTLEGLEVTDSSGEVSCNRGQPLASLDVEDSHTCRVSHKVSMFTTHATVVVRLSTTVVPEQGGISK